MHTQCTYFTHMCPHTHLLAYVPYRVHPASRALLGRTTQTRGWWGKHRVRVHVHPCTRAHITLALPQRVAAAQVQQQRTIGRGAVALCVREREYVVSASTVRRAANTMRTQQPTHLTPARRPAPRRQCCWVHNVSAHNRCVRTHAHTTSRHIHAHNLIAMRCVYAVVKRSLNTISSPSYTAA
jgi:hypothetical protein